MDIKKKKKNTFVLSNNVFVKNMFVFYQQKFQNLKNLKLIFSINAKKNEKYV